MKRARFHTLLAPALAALLAAGAGCGGGTRACKQGTLFVTIVLHGTTSAADVIAVGVSIDRGMAKSDSHPRTAGGTTETIEINFPNGYPTGKPVDVQVTAYMGGSQIAMKTGTVASLTDGCGALTVTLEPGTGGTGGTGGGAGGRGGAGGSTSGAAGRGGTTGAGGGLSCPALAAFDTSGLQGFALNNYMDTGANARVNLAVREAGAKATLAWNATEGDPSAGSLRVDAPFDAYNQSVDVQHVETTGKDWRGTKLHVRVKVVGGNPTSANPMGIQPYFQTGTSFSFCGNYITFTGGAGWNDYVVDSSACALPVDPSMAIGYGVTIQTGNGSGSGGTLPTPAVIYVDSFWLEGSCSGTGGAGGGLAGRGGAGGGLAGRGGAGGGLAGRGGTGGGSAGAGGTVGPPPCKFASFDSGSEGFILNTNDTSAGNLVLRDGGSIATMTWDGAEGFPTPGSLKIDAPYTDYKQHVDVTSTFSGARNLAGLKLHVRLKIASGLDQSVNSPPGVQPWASSFNVGSKGLGYYWKGNWIVVTSGHAWADYVLDLKPDGDFDPTQIISFGVTIDAGDGLIGGSTVNPAKPTRALIYVDSIWFEGTTCTGGAGGFSGGAGGAGGSTGCRYSDPPSSALVTDFSMVDGGVLVIPIGGTYSYGTPAGTPAPTAAIQNGAWHVTLNLPGMVTAQYTGVGMFFNGNSAGTDCLDVSAYSGMSFKISGSVTGTGCGVWLAVSDSEHSDSSVDGKNSGPAGSFSPSASVPLSLITTTPQTVSIPFTTLTGGSPATALNKVRLVGAQWQFNVAAGTANACNVDVNIDDVRFY